MPYVVENAYRGHDEAEFGRQLAAQGFDLLGEAIGTVFVFLDRAEQTIAELELEFIDLETVGNGLFVGLRLLPARAGLALWWPW